MKNWVMEWVRKKDSPRRRGGAEKTKNLPRRHRDTEKKRENALICIRARASAVP